MASSPTFACLRVWGRLGAESRMPWALQLPRAPRLQASTVPGYDGGAMLVSPLPSPTPCPSKLEAGVAPPPTRRPTTGFEATSSCPKATAPSTLEPRRKNEYVPRNISFLGATGDRRDGSRLTAPPQPKYCCRLHDSNKVPSRGRGQGPRGACDVIFRSPWSPAPPSLVVGETTPSRLDSTSFPSVPVSIEFPSSLRPSRPRPTRISRLVAKIPGWFPQVHHHPTASGSSHLVVVWCLARRDGGWRRVRQKRWGCPAACGR